MSETPVPTFGGLFHEMMAVWTGVVLNTAPELAPIQAQVRRGDALIVVAHWQR